MKDEIRFTGIPSAGDLAAIPGIAGEERFEKGAVAVIECVQEIPCNPCEKACPFGAITVGQPITSLPVLDEEKCTGCGACLAKCPGLAIFRVHKNYTEDTALVEFPFEYLPLPQEGDTVACGGRDGNYVCDGKILKINQSKAFDGTTLVAVAVPKEHYMTVRTICRKKEANL